MIRNDWTRGQDEDPVGHSYTVLAQDEASAVEAATSVMIASGRTPSPVAPLLVEDHADGTFEVVLKERSPLYVAPKPKARGGIDYGNPARDPYLTGKGRPEGVDHRTVVVR